MNGLQQAQDIMSKVFEFASYGDKTVNAMKLKMAFSALMYKDANEEEVGR